MNEIQKFILEKENANDASVIVSELFFVNGDKVSAGDIVADIETSKVIYSLESDFDGYICYLCKQGDEIPIGSTIAILYDSTDFLSSNAHINDTVVSNDNTSFTTEFSFSALELLQQNNIERSVFLKNHFVTKFDVLDYLNSQNQVLQKSTQLLETEIEKISSIKKREIQHLQSIQSSGLTCTFSINIDYDGVSLFCRKNHSLFLLSITPTLIYEIAQLLVEYPQLNSYFENDTIVKYKPINIGYALDIKNGLKVVTLYDTNLQTVADIEIALQEKIEAYSKNELSAKDMMHSTITITDLSHSGIHFFSPLINKNQAIIIGISSADFKTNSLNISITFDHRVTEGKIIAEFLNRLKTNIEIKTKPFSSKQQRIKLKEKLSDSINALENDNKQLQDICSILNEINKLL